MKPRKLGVTAMRDVGGETFTPELAAGFAQVLAVVVS